MFINETHINFPSRSSGISSGFWLGLCISFPIICIKYLWILFARITFSFYYGFPVFYLFMASRLSTFILYFICCLLCYVVVNKPDTHSIAWKIILFLLRVKQRISVELQTIVCAFFFIPRLTTLKTTREESPMSNVHTPLFQNSFVLVSWPDSPL